VKHGLAAKSIREHKGGEISHRDTEVTQRKIKILVFSPQRGNFFSHKSAQKNTKEEAISHTHQKHKNTKKILSVFSP
jgi:hypothetical protein